jgi:hypothetical protein
MANITKKYTLEIDGQQAEATVGQVKKEVERLEAELEKVQLGSLDADKLIAELGRAKAALKDIDEAVDVAFSKDRAGAYVDAVNGIAGAYGIALVAAQNFGLSEKDVAKYQQKLTEVIAVVSSLEQIQRLTTSEVRSAFKLLASDTLGQIKNVFALGKAYIVGGESATTAGKATRGALLATGIGALLLLVGLLIANFDTVKEYAGKIREKFQPQFDVVGKVIDTLIAKARNLASALTFGLIDDAATAAKAKAKEAGDAALQVVIDNRARRIAVLTAEGKDVAALKARQIADELKLLKNGTAEEQKAFADKNNELLVLIAETNKKRADESEKAHKERLAKEKEELQKSLAAQLEAAHRRDAALGQSYQKQKNVEMQVMADLLALQIENEAKRLAELEKYASKAVKLTVKTMEQEARETDLLDTLLVRFLGVGSDQLDAVRAKVVEALSSLKENSTALVGAIFEGEMSALDAQISQTQSRLSEIDSQLQQSAAAAQQAENALLTSSGAKRDFYLQKLAKEHAETERLTAAKRKAADEEKKQMAERAKLEKEQQRLIAITTLATGIASAAIAVKAGVSAISGAAALPFPASVPAMVAALAAVVGVVASAKGLANTFEAGGLVNGPRHSQGGVQMWHRNGAHLGEMEGGEFIFSRRAVNAIGVPALAQMNAAANIRVLPPPSWRYADGGLVGGYASLDRVAALEAKADRTNMLLEMVVNHTANTSAYSKLNAEKPPIVPDHATALAYEERLNEVKAAKADAIL